MQSCFIGLGKGYVLSFQFNQISLLPLKQTNKNPPHTNLPIKKGAGGLQRHFQRAKLKRQVIRRRRPASESIGITHPSSSTAASAYSPPVQIPTVRQPPLQLHHILQHVIIERVEQQDLISGDDASDLLEIDDDGLLSAEDGGGIDEEGVKKAEIAGGEIAAAHHGELIDLDDLGVAGGVDADPGAEALAALLEAEKVHALEERAAGGGRARRERRVSSVYRR